jgi:hypothetical protein
MLDALVMSATRSRTLDIVLVAGYAVAVPVLIRVVRSRRRQRATAALAGHGARVLALPERTPIRPVVDEPEVIDVEPELAPEPETEPEPEPEVVQPAVTLAPVPPAPRAERAEPRRPRPFGESPADVEPELTADDIDECEIVVWRGFRKSHFYAAPVVDDGVVAIGLYTSPLFRARGGELQETDEAVAAYDELVAKLERDDWELVDTGEAWYAGRFRRAENGRGAPH